MLRRRTGAFAALILALTVLSVAAATAQADALFKETYLVSTSDEDAVFGEDSVFAAISKDGLSAFWTTEESLLAADTDNDNVDIYGRFDNKTTQLITPGGDEDATFLAASDDGSKVFFYLGAFGSDIYRRNLDANPPTTTNMTPGTSGQVRFGGINTAGDRLFFNSEDRLAGGDSDDETDVYLSVNGALSRVSTGSNGGNDPCPARYSGSTPDGQHVFFSTDESMEPNDGWDPEQDCSAVFNDRGTPDIHRWSGGSVTNITPTGGCAPGAGASCASDRFAWSSLDGSRAIFLSTGLHDPDDLRDGWCLDDLYQTLSGAVSKLSTSQWDGTEYYCSDDYGRYPVAFAGASEDARTVYWTTREPGVAGASDEHRDIFRNISGGAPTLMTPNTPNADANFAWTTPDGSDLFYSTTEPVVTDSDTASDVFRRSGSGTVTKVTTGPLGGNSNAFNAAFDGATDDASHVFFGTGEPLTADDEDATGRDVYDRSGGETELISTGPLAGSDNFTARFDGTTQDGERVFFSTHERLVPQDTDQREDVYMRWRGDRSLAPGPTVRVDEFALDPEFVELRKTGGEEMPPEDQFPDESAPYKLVVFDGNGGRVGGQVIGTSLLRNQFRFLFSDTHANKDAPLDVALPAAGQICFTQGLSEQPVNCVAYGCIAEPVQQSITRVSAPPPGSSEQRQAAASETFHVATPTPGEQNGAGTVAEPCPGDPDPAPDPDPTPDPGPDPGPDLSAPAGPPPPPFGGVGPLVPLDVPSILPVTPLSPLEGGYTATCPAALGAACAVQVDVRQSASGPRTARAAQAGALLAQGSATIAPGQSGRVDLRFTDAGNKALADLKTVPITVTVQVTAGGRTATSTTASKMLANVGTDPAKLQIQRAGVKNGRLDVLARITRRATGEVRVAYQAAGRTTRFDAKIEQGTIRISRRLPSSQRRTRTGIVTFEWRGNDRVRPTEVRLRAATRKAQLRRRSLSVQNGRLRVSGTISSRVSGVVRLRVGYVDQGEVKFWTGRARISRGRWSASSDLPQAARADGYLSIQFTGDRRARGGPIRGEQDGKAL